MSLPHRDKAGDLFFAGKPGDRHVYVEGIIIYNHINTKYSPPLQSEGLGESQMFNANPKYKCEATNTVVTEAVSLFGILNLL